MMKNIKFIIFRALVVITFTSPQLVNCMEDLVSIEHVDKNAFSARKAMLRECMNQYKELTSPWMTFGALYNACDVLHPLYERRLEFNRQNNLDDQACEKIYNSWMMKIKREEWTERWHTGFGGTVTRVLEHLKEDQLNNLESSIQLIKEDISNSIRIYERLYGPYPQQSDNCIIKWTPYRLEGGSSRFRLEAD